MKESTGSKGWIKLHRQILEWEWIDDSQTFHLFHIMLLLANHKDGNWHGKEIKKGSFVTSIGSLSEITNISTRAVRTILDRLEKSGEIAKQTTNKYTLITIKKYSVYQGNEEEEENFSSSTAKQLPNNCQTTAKQLPTNKNKKNKKNEKNLSTATPGGDQFNFNTPERMTIEQSLDVELFWSSLIKIYKPVGDKSLHNTKLKKEREKIINNFTKEERDKILEWFTKYKVQLEIVGPWLGNFFRDHSTIESVAEYFRSIKDVKPVNKNKGSTGQIINRNVKEDFDKVEGYDPFANK